MKTIIIKSLKELVADRYLLVLLVLLFILSIILALMVGLSIRSSEIQLVSHYSAFGITQFYRDQWYYLFVFVAFELIVAVLHSIISVKLLVTKGHSIAIMFAWFGISIVLIGYVTAMSVLNAWKPL